MLFTTWGVHHHRYTTRPPETVEALVARSEPFVYEARTEGPILRRLHRVAEWRERLSGAALAAVAEGRACLLLDDMWEVSAAHPAMFEALHALLGALRVPPRHVVLATNNHLLPANYAAWLAGREGVRAVAVEFFECWLAARVRAEPHLFASLDETEAMPPEARPATFLSLTRRLRAPRLAMAAKLLELGVLQGAMIGFPAPSPRWLPMVEGSCHRDIFARGAERAVGDLTAVAPLRAAAEDLDAPLWNHHVPEPYRQTRFSLVAETYFDGSAGVLVNVSEKTFKAVANHHPFLLAGAPGTLHHLRERGYRTFSPAFNEGYDLVGDDAARLSMLAFETARLASQTPAWWRAAWRDTLLPAVRHNARRLLLSKPWEIAVEDALWDALRP